LKSSNASVRNRVANLALFVFVLFVPVLIHAQADSRLEGTIVDVQGKAVASAVVTVTNESTKAVRTTTADTSGLYSFDSLTGGKYTVAATASGFAAFSRTGVELADGQTLQVALKLTVNSVAEMVTVNAGIDSIAAQNAPSGGFIEERSAQSLISSTYIQNFTSPVADFGEIVQIVPGAFTTSSDGVGLGQSKTYFRGFPDGDYDIDFDGIPFYDTNSPTHHSWLSFPLNGSAASTSIAAQALPPPSAPPLRRLHPSALHAPHHRAGRPRHRDLWHLEYPALRGLL